MKLKNLLIALLMIVGTTLMAQEKYEQAIVTQINGFEIDVSVEGQGFKMINIMPAVDHSDFTNLFKQVTALRNDGWEVWNSTSSVEGHLYKVSYFLRRKLK